MKVLITGGAGFIGSNYVYTHLESRPEDELIILDALTYAGHRDNLKEAEAKGVKFVEGRIEDVELIDQLFAETSFDWVVHFAAETHVDRSIEDPGVFVRTNVTGTQVLLDACKKHGIKRFHHISTDEVYGDLGFDSTDEFEETMILEPSSPYSASKASSDLLCLAYRRTFGVPITISRCSNNYGPYQDDEKLIPSFIGKAQRNEKLPLYGTGKNVRDWLFVRDHCEAIIAILEKGQEGEIYNIGGGTELENIQITKTILDALGRPESLIEYVEDRAGHDQRYAVNFDKLHKATGWQPRFTFEEGMRQTIEWYKQPIHERSYSCWRDRIASRSTD